MKITLFRINLKSRIQITINNHHKDLINNKIMILHKIQINFKKIMKTQNDLWKENCKLKIVIFMITIKIRNLEN